jgi:hypothetical protein
MSNKKCNLCNREFKSVQGLIRHQNRKIPCNKIEEFKCNKCNKFFTTKRYLSQHLNRKTPCIKKVTSSLDDQKEMIHLHAESEIKILEKKKEIQKEVIELQYEKKKGLIEMQKGLIEMQKEKELAVEEKKFKRKVAAPRQTIINNIIQQVNVNMPARNKISATYKNCIEEIVMPFIKRVENGSYSAYELVYESPRNKAELATHIIQDVFQNETTPSNQNIVYITELDLFMVVLHKAWVYKQFEYIANIMTETFKLCFSAIKSRVGAPIRCNFLSDKLYEKAILKYAELEELAHINITAEELEQISKDGLNIDDILTGKKLILAE